MALPEHTALQHNLGWRNMRKRRNKQEKREAGILSAAKKAMPKHTLKLHSSVPIPALRAGL